MPDLGPAELLIVLAIVVLIFGPSRLGDLGGGLGKGLRAFKQGLSDDEPSAATSAEQPGENVCPACEQKNEAGARFCIECGAALTKAEEHAEAH
ncbi:MAG TPA: twin-arginine translocase TatA/TatE family subunit [Dehalococcoidia bacterium]|jgi:sec-independent protein translocase protein TatA|nr:twin-arginine translocase TatA/TatE family subunit [Dehalococcoidia bacterium]